MLSDVIVEGSDVSHGLQWCYIRGKRVLEPGYEGIRAGVRGYYIRGKRVLEPGNIPLV